MFKFFLEEVYILVWNQLIKKKYKHNWVCVKICCTFTKSLFFLSKWCTQVSTGHEGQCWRDNAMERSSNADLNGSDMASHPQTLGPADEGTAPILSDSNEPNLTNLETNINKIDNLLEKYKLVGRESPTEANRSDADYRLTVANPATSSVPNANQPDQESSAIFYLEDEVDCGSLETEKPKLNENNSDNHTQHNRDKEEVVILENNRDGSTFTPTEVPDENANTKSTSGYNRAHHSKDQLEWQHIFHEDSATFHVFQVPVSRENTENLSDKFPSTQLGPWLDSPSVSSGTLNSPEIPDEIIDSPNIQWDQNPGVEDSAKVADEPRQENLTPIQQHSHSNLSQTIANILPSCSFSKYTSYQERPTCNQSLRWAIRYIFSHPEGKCGSVGCSFGGCPPWVDPVVDPVDPAAPRMHRVSKVFLRMEGPHLELGEQTKK